MSWNTEEAFGLKVGERIRLIKMNDDPHPMAPGSTGTVTGLHEGAPLNQIQMKWDPGVMGHLHLIPECDVWEVITGEVPEEGDAFSVENAWA